MPTCSRFQLLPTLLLTSSLVAACKDDPPAIPECPGTSGGGEACEEPPPPEPTPTCAEPEFGGTHPTATEYTCEGEAGGALVYNQVSYEIDGEDRAGPGAIQLDPVVTEFPGEDAAVSACCYDLDPMDQDDKPTLESACYNDCARGACNRILEELRDAAFSADPSNGRCDPLPAGAIRNGCRDRVEGSLLTWIAHLEENYDDCVVAAAASRQPTAPFTDPEAAFNADRKIELPDSGCNTNLIGCLYGAELRPYCLIDDDGFTDAGTCDQAGNLEDPNGPVGGDSGGSGGVLEDVASQPFGDIESLVNCSRPRLCTIEEELVENFALNYNQFYNEGVEFNLVTVGTWPEYTGLQVTGLELGDDAKELLDAFDIRNNDVITHVNGEALDSGEAVWEIVGDLFDVSTWEITGRRQVFPGNGWKAIEYDISLATSLTRRPAPSDLAVRANDETTGSSEASGEASGCGCASGGSSPASFAAMLLGFLGLRPRHWRRRWSARRR